MDNLDIVSLILFEIQDLRPCFLLSKFYYGFKGKEHFWKLRLQRRYNVLVITSCHDLCEELDRNRPNSEQFFIIAAKYGVTELIEPKLLDRTIRNNLASTLLEVSAVHGHLNLVKLFYGYLGRFSNFRTGLDQLIEKVEEHPDILKYIFSKVSPYAFQLISDEKVEELKLFIRDSHITRRVWILMAKSLGKLPMIEFLLSVGTH